MKLLRLVGATCVFTATMLSHSVNAALINADWKNLDDNLLTKDTVSLLSWLDITETAGMSRNNVLAETGAGGIFEGFRYATSDEVINLWSQYGITLTPVTRVIDSGVLDRKIITAAQQLGNLYGQVISFSDYGTLGLIALDGNTSTTGWAGAYRQSGSSYYEGPTIKSLTADQSELWLGSYMVTTVPIPAAAWLFASGLLALAGFSCRKA